MKWESVSMVTTLHPEGLCICSGQRGRLMWFPVRQSALVICICPVSVHSPGQGVYSTTAGPSSIRMLQTLCVDMVSLGTGCSPSFGFWGSKNHFFHECPLHSTGQWGLMIRTLFTTKPVISASGTDPSIGPLEIMRPNAQYEQTVSQVGHSGRISRSFVNKKENSGMLIHCTWLFFTMPI